MPLAVELDEELVEVPAPLIEPTHSALTLTTEVGREQRAEDGNKVALTEQI